MNLGECPVCFEKLSTKLAVRIPCGENQGHSICMQCLIHLEEKKCPLCRKSFEQFIPNIKKETRSNLILLLTHQYKGDEFVQNINS